MTAPGPSIPDHPTTFSVDGDFPRCSGTKYISSLKRGNIARSRSLSFRRAATRCNINCQSNSPIFLFYLPTTACNSYTERAIDLASDFYYDRFTVLLNYIIQTSKRKPRRSLVVEHCSL